MGSQSSSKPYPLYKPIRKEAFLPPPSNPRIPIKTPDPNPNPNPNPNPDPGPSLAGSTASNSTSSSLCLTGDDPVLTESNLLSREEVLRRRSRRLRRLMRCYMDRYWALIEEVRKKHREYYWKYGLSPLEEEKGAGFEGNGVDAGVSVVGEEVVGENRVAVKRERSQCAFAGCKVNAMPLTRFCHSHILSDRNQTLYRACSYAVKSGQTGPIICGKPVLRAAVPTLCSSHLQKAQKHISNALKKAGLNISSSSKPAPKLHVIIAEYLNQIQTKRREAAFETAKSIAELDRNAS